MTFTFLTRGRGVIQDFKSRPTIYHLSRSFTVVVVAGIFCHRWPTPSLIHWLLTDWLASCGPRNWFSKNWQQIKGFRAALFLLPAFTPTTNRNNPLFPAHCVHCGSSFTQFRVIWICMVRSRTRENGERQKPTDREWISVTRVTINYIL